MNQIRSLVVVTACAAASSFLALGDTYYADFHGTKSYYAYDWFNKDNWKVMDEGGNLVAATNVPPEGSDVIVNSGCGQMSAYPDGSLMAAINSIVFNAKPADPMHQGYIGLLSNGPGLKVVDGVSISTWAGLRFKGSGDAIIDIGTGGNYTNQKGVGVYAGTDQVTLIKKGKGTFSPVDEQQSAYSPVRTILMGGLFAAKNMKPTSGHEFVFGANDPDIRVRLSSYSKSGTTYYYDLTIQNGALIESNEVDNTAHGFSATDDSHGYYVRLTGTPKLAEQRFTGTLYNSAGIAFCPGAKQGNGDDYLFTLAKAVHPERQGRLAVTNGTMRLVEGATFKSLQTLNVGPTGTFKIESGSGARAFALSLDVAAGGKLDLAEGVTLSANEVRIGGETMTNGTYTAANCAAITGAGSLAVTPYSSLDTIVLDVASQTDITAALAAYNEASGESVTLTTLNGGVDKSRPLVKRGEGLLIMNQPIANYSAAVYVEEGAMRTDVRYSIGKENVATAPVFVRSGATFTTLTTNTVMNANRTFHIAGNGNSTYKAALHCYGNGVPQNWGNTGCLGAYVILDDDATAHVEAWMFAGNSTLTLNGHTLSFTMGGGKDADRPGHLPTKIVGPGEIIVTGGQMRLPSTLNFVNSGRIVLGQYGGFRLTSQGVCFSGDYKKWTLQADGPDILFYADYNISPRDANLNVYDMPTVANTMLRLMNQSDRNRNYMLVKTPVSGTGGFSTTGTCTSFLHLLDAAQTYTGGITFDQGVIWAYPNGSIPAADGAGDVVLSPSQTPLKTTNSAPFTNTFNGVAFMCPVTYALPGLVSKGTQPARVQNGQGAWKSVTQNGTGGLEYYSSLGAGLLDVKKGTVKFGRGMMAGLWEGTNIYANASAASAAYATSVCFTNLAVRGPTSAIQEPGHNYTNWKTNEVITYTGYIWNRGSETVTWSLASALTGSVTVKVDGNEVFSGANQILHGNVTLSPGAHAFEYRACCANTTTPAAPITSGWKSRHGFAIDKQGRNTANADDYEMGVDTGDGALFTRTADPSEGLPQFGLVNLAANTKLDLNGNAYTADNLAGGGEIVSTATDALAAGRLVLKGLTVDASKDETLAINVPASLDAGFAVTVTNAATRLRKRHRAFVLKEPLATVPANVPVTVIPDDGSYWSAQISSDGKTLTVAKAGFGIILR